MPVRMLALLLVMGWCPAAFAAADKKCNGDVPIRRCSAVILYGSTGVGPEPATCAALTWRIGRVVPDAKGDLTGFAEDSHYAQLVEPEGKWTPQYDAVETGLCWEVRAINSKEERPQDLRDAREKVRLTCDYNPKDINVLLPQLIDVGRVSIDPDKRELTFFGVLMTYIKHSGSEYLGIDKEFAVTVHKTTGKYTVVLAGGGSLTGSCKYLQS